MAKSNLFSRLSRLFSTDVIIRDTGGGKLDVVDINNVQSTGQYQTNSLIDRFNRLHINSIRNVFTPNMNYQTMRVQLYSDYEAMDTDPIIASSLDIVADEATLKNEEKEILSIKTSDEKVKNALQNLYYDVLNIEFNLWTWVRNMCKYGDFFLKLEISEQFGVYNALPYTVYNISREEGVDEENPFKAQFVLHPDGLASTSGPTTHNSKGRNKIILDNYEVGHFRLLSDTNYLPYGRSYLEPARKIFKQMTLMEDAMLIHRIMRAPDKRTFFINVGTIPPNEVDQFMQKTVDNIKKTPYIDPETGEYNLKFNIQNMMEDFYIPVRGGDTNTRIENTPGLQYDGIQDVEYLRDKLFSALKVPKAYFGYEGDLQGKATLAAEDIRFARTVERVQRIIESELTKIGLIHLYTQGFKGESLTNFKISLTTPSIIYEQEKVALLQEKMQVANDMTDSDMFPTDYVYEKIFNFSEEEYREMRKLVIEDKKRTFRLQQIENEGNDPTVSGVSFGTPHDLATLYGRRSGETPKVPAGYSEKDSENPPGRPKKHASFIGTPDDPLGGRDRLGNKVDMKGGYPSDNENVKEDTFNTDKTKAIYHQNRDLFKKDLRILSEEGSENTENILNERNIKDLED